MELGTSAKPGAPPRDQSRDDQVRLLVVGGHLSGQPLNPELTRLGARLVGTARTAPEYRFYALPGQPPRPGMIRVASGGGQIEGEIWCLSAEAFGRFVSAIPSPLGIGRVQLEDRSEVSGFLCEAVAVTEAEEITRFGSWRSYRDALG